jgi:hypothetical protein
MPASPANSPSGPDPSLCTNADLHEILRSGDRNFQSLTKQQPLATRRSLRPKSVAADGSAPAVRLPSGRRRPPRCDSPTGSTPGAAGEGSGGCG